MDSADAAAVWGIVGGLAGGAVNWSVRGSPEMQLKGNYMYYALFASMGCMSGSLIAHAFPTISTSVESVAFAGGFIGCYVLLGIGNYF